MLTCVFESFVCTCSDVFIQAYDIRMQVDMGRLLGHIVVVPGPATAASGLATAFQTEFQTTSLFC